MLIRVLSSHRPALDIEGMRQFIAREIEHFRAFWQRRIVEVPGSSSEEELSWRAPELAEELENELMECALFEIAIDLREPTTSESQAAQIRAFQWGWEPVCLSADGLSMLSELGKPPSNVDHYRIAFWWPNWKDGNTLDGPTGELDFPTFTPVPQRLWQLAPYSTVD